MQKNYLHQVLILCSVVLFTLLIFSSFPPSFWNIISSKPIDILADIRPTPPESNKTTLVIDSSKMVAPTKRITQKKDSCKPGITCIEDFSADKKGLAYFFKALKNVKGKPVRIAFFGDSFIEGDILCGSFRDTLQYLYGGRGVGFVPITSEVAQFRTTVQHTFSNWKTYSIVGEKSPFAPLGTSGFCFVPLPENHLEYRPGRKRNTRPFRSLKLYYQNQQNNSLNIKINDTLTLIKELSPSDSLQEMIVWQREMQSIELRFTIDSLKVYGVSMEDTVGVYVDNFSMRGNSGMGLYQIGKRHTLEFNRYRNYKLIILQYGLNVVTETDTTGYQWYRDKMIKVVEQLKEHFPETSILMVSISDRGSNQNGVIKTIPSIPVMRNIQREIASRTGVVFWDLYSAMGGENSMVKYTEAISPLGAKDYTHLTFLGGRKIARQLADALLYERLRYEKRK